VVGKVSEDRFNGGLRITAEKVFDIAAARIQYGHKLEMDLACTIAPGEAGRDPAAVSPAGRPAGQPARDAAGDSLRAAAGRRRGGWRRRMS
jgi:DNA polymerase-3 subunit alpha